MAKTIINIRTQNEWVCQIICTFAEYKPQKRNEEISHADIARQCKNNVRQFRDKATDRTPVPIHRQQTRCGDGYLFR